MADKRKLKNSEQQGFPGPRGRTLIERIETQMDKRRKKMEEFVVQHGMAKCLVAAPYLTEVGRYEGLSAALAILRSSTVEIEISRSNERLGIE